MATVKRPGAARPANGGEMENESDGERAIRVVKEWRKIEYGTDSDLRLLLAQEFWRIRAEESARRKNEQR